MTKQARNLLDEALRLSVTERAELAAELLASMDGAPEQDAEQAWAAEIQTRAERALSGASTGRDAEEVLDRIEKKLRGR